MRVNLFEKQERKGEREERQGWRGCGAVETKVKGIKSTDNNDKAD